MLIAGTRLIPWFLKRLAYLQSRELFIIAVVVITVGTAMGAATLFGVSLALGAFMAGMVVSESSLSHQVEAELLPFRETFGVLFFVSVGMLINPLALLPHAWEILAIVGIIIIGKFLLTILIGAIFRQSAHTMLVVAAGRSQIGEFSFILGQMGVAMGMLSQEEYSLILAGALISIIVNPFIFRALPWVEAQLRRLPALWNVIDGEKQPTIASPTALKDHVIVVGYGRVGSHTVQVLQSLNISHLVIDLDARRISELDKAGVPALYGDAAESAILTHASVAGARAVVVTLPDEAAAAVVVATVRQLSSTIPLVVRAATQQGVEQLFQLGASEVIHPELEGGLNIVQQTLSYLGCNKTELEKYLQAVRRDHYDISMNTAGELEALSQLRETLTAQVER
jgi:CPA2 family monovalent cation:H+ antiporter-2